MGFGFDKINLAGKVPEGEYTGKLTLAEMTYPKDKEDRTIPTLIISFNELINSLGESVSGRVDYRQRLDEEASEKQQYARLMDVQRTFRVIFNSEDLVIASDDEFQQLLDAVNSKKGSLYKIAVRENLAGYRSVEVESYLEASAEEIDA